MSHYQHGSLTTALAKVRAFEVLIPESIVFNAVINLPAIGSADHVFLEHSGLTGRGCRTHDYPAKLCTFEQALARPALRWRAALNHYLVNVVPFKEILAAMEDRVVGLGAVARRQLPGFVSNQGDGGFRVIRMVVSTTVTSFATTANATQRVAMYFSL